MTANKIFPLQKKSDIRSAIELIFDRNIEECVLVRVAGHVDKEKIMIEIESLAGKWEISKEITTWSSDASKLLDAMFSCNEIAKAIKIIGIEFYLK